jgi:hypothetical protein
MKARMREHEFGKSMDGKWRIHQICGAVLLGAGVAATEAPNPGSFRKSIWRPQEPGRGATLAVPFSHAFCDLSEQRTPFLELWSAGIYRR